MTKIRLSRKAIADLDSIWDYTVATWSEEQAVIYYRQIYTAIQGLNSLPVFLEKEYNVVKKSSEIRCSFRASDGTRTRTGLAAQGIFLPLWLSPPGTPQGVVFVVWTIPSP